MKYNVVCYYSDIFLGTMSYIAKESVSLKDAEDFIKTKSEYDDYRIEAVR